MRESRDVGGLDELIEQLISMTSEVVRDQSIAAPDLRTVLRFINKVVQVADQVLQDVYAVLLDIQFLQEGDLSTGRVIEVRRGLRSLTARSRYRDAEEICSRLHHLSEEFGQVIEPILVNVAEKNSWRYIFGLLNEHEGYIIDIIESTVLMLDHMLGSLNAEADSRDLLRVTSAAHGRSLGIRAALLKLEQLRNQILGLSGTPGLMALMSSSDREHALRGAVQEIRTGDTYNVQGAVAVGRGASAGNFAFYQTWQNLANQDTQALARDLAQLRAELKMRPTSAEQDLAIGELASAQIAAEAGDGPAALSHLARLGKWVVDAATSIGTTVAAAAIQKAMHI
jgi:hypothetical protein